MKLNKEEEKKKQEIFMNDFNGTSRSSSDDRKAQNSLQVMLIWCICYSNLDLHMLYHQY